MNEMATPPRAARVYRFGDFRLDPGSHLLMRRDGTPISLKPKSYDTLAYLVERAGTVLQKTS
jgi:DNA-binding response OmpR family regulator